MSRSDKIVVALLALAVLQAGLYVYWCVEHLS